MLNMGGEQARNQRGGNRAIAPQKFWKTYCMCLLGTAIGYIILPPPKTSAGCGSGGEPNYYRGPHELCIITGGSKIQVILSQNSIFINYEEEWLLLNYYLSTCLSCCFVLTWCCTLAWVTNILVRALSNVRASRIWPAGRRFPTPMLKSRSTVHEVAWQFNNLAYSSGLTFVWPVISTIAFRSLFSSNRLSKRTELYWNSSQACFLNHAFTFYAIGLLDKSCMWKRKKLQYKIPAFSSSYYINSEYFRSCWKLLKMLKNLPYS